MSPCHQTQFPCINYHVLQAWLTINIIIKVCMMFMDIETWRFEFYFKGWNAIKYFAFTVWTKTQQQIPESLSCRYAFTFFFFFIQIFGKWLDVNFIREIFLIFQACPIRACFYKWHICLSDFCLTVSDSRGIGEFNFNLTGTLIRLI